VGGGQDSQNLKILLMYRQAYLLKYKQC